MNTSIPSAPRPVVVRGVVLGTGRPKIIVPLTARTRAELTAQGRDAVAAAPDLIEWRVDHLLAGGADPAAVVDAGRELVAVLDGLPLLVTLRTAAEGGEHALTDQEYFACYQELLAASVGDLVDVEIMRDVAAETIAAAHAASIPVVASNHDFDATPPRQELVRRLLLMAERGADVVKIAVMPQGPGDVLALLEATWEVRQEVAQPVITMSMAAAGVLSRVGGGVFGSAATFATVGAASAPGQVDVTTLRTVLNVVHP